MITSTNSFSLKNILVWVSTIATYIITSEAAISNPVLIDPAQQYQNSDYIVNSGGVNGYAYDFCFQNQTLGYIVVSAQAAVRLERYYPFRSVCFREPTSSSQSVSTTFLQDNGYVPESYSNSVSNSRSYECRTSGYYTRVVRGKSQRVRCPRR